MMIQMIARIQQDTLIKIETDAQILTVMVIQMLMVPGLQHKVLMSGLMIRVNGPIPILMATVITRLEPILMVVL